MLEPAPMDGIDPVFRALHDAGVAAVVMIEEVEEAVPLARALAAGGVKAMELALRTEAALPAMRAIAAEVPEMLLGAGTVLTADQVGSVKDAGARFAVAPGTNAEVVGAAAEAGLPFAPGVATPSDIEAALAQGCRILKLFPAGELGGLRYLNSVVAPYRHLGVRFIPLGGVNEANLGEYAASLDVLAVGGSWLAPVSLVAAGRWEEITHLAKEARRIVDAARQGASS